MSDDRSPDLETTPRDRAIELLKGAASFAPGIGPVIANALLNDLPGQRLNRFADFVRQLDKRLAGIEAERLKEKLQDSEYLDLFEEGAMQSARAISEDRRQYLANLVGHGLSGDEKARIEARRLLALVQEIDDDQIIILASYLDRNRGRDFHEKHADVLKPVIATLGGGSELRDRATVHDLARTELIRLGVLRSRFKKPFNNKELPEFDADTGMMKSSGRELTPLGRLLLRRAGLAGDDEL